MASSERDCQPDVISREEVRGLDLPCTGEVTIGRDEASTLRIDDPSVSRRHAVLRVGDTLEIEDLGGTNASFLRQVSRGSVATLLGISGTVLVGADATLYLAHRSGKTAGVGQGEAQVATRFVLGASPGAVVARIGGRM